MVPDSPAGTGFPQVRPEDAPEFLEHFLRVVSESRRTTSYKLILVLSLLDAVKLTSPAAGLPTRLPVRHLAERAIQILWPQVRPFNDLALRQMSGAKGTAKIPEAVARLRSRTGESLGRLRCSPAGEARYQETVREIAWLLVWWPIPRLQTVLGEVVEFLWPVPHSWRGIGNDKLPDAAIDRDEAGYPVLWLFPGVADLLIRVGGLLRPHVEDTWTLQVADWNNLRQDPSLALRSHLFPNADRSSLPDSLRELLIAIHHGHCFWCERS
ncbi:MAG: hypothetical protein FJZ00_05035, partial [Candidatus Sericytochromatia bacterium]|nr:hypothetical protein [Candidatus Tanganyikabacteria bacterium]